MRIAGALRFQFLGFGSAARPKLNSHFGLGLQTGLLHFFDQPEPIADWDGDEAAGDLDDVETQILADARGFCEDGGIGAEKLGGDRMLVRVKSKLALQRLIGFTGFQRRADPMRAGELSHDEPAPAQISNKAAEYGIRHAGHGREHRGWGEIHRADRELGWKDLHGIVNVILSSGQGLSSGS